MDIVSLIVTVIVIGLVAGILYWAVGALGIIPMPIANIIRVFIVVVSALYVISVLFGHTPSVRLLR